MEEIKKMLTQLMEGQESLRIDVTGMKSDIKDLKQGQNRIESKLDVVHAQTARTCEDISQISDKLDIISKDLNVVEAVTGKNMTDIAHLKAVK